jgi:hypothetical protein
VTSITTASPVAATTKKGTDMTQVRTTFTPDTVIDVPDAEADSLQGQGLLFSREHGTGPLPEGLKPWRSADADEVIVSPDRAAEAEVASTPDSNTKKKG